MQGSDITAKSETCSQKQFTVLLRTLQGCLLIALLSGTFPAPFLRRVIYTLLCAVYLLDADLKPFTAIYCHL